MARLTPRTQPARDAHRAACIQLLLDFTSPTARYATHRAAFEALAHQGPAERALHALISQQGLSGAASLLGVAPKEVLRWVEFGEVPPHHHAALLTKRLTKATRRGPLPQGVIDPRRERFRALNREGLSTSKIASILGIARDTVMRWRAQEKGE